MQLDAELASAEEALVADDEVASLKRAIAARESQLMPLYVQISHEFADLHDRPGRMKAKGVIRDVVPWERAREYFYWRVRRRLREVADQVLPFACKADHDYVLVGRRDAKDRDFQDLLADMRSALSMIEQRAEQRKRRRSGHHRGGGK